MSRARAMTTGIWLALLMAACGSTSPSSQGGSGGTASGGQSGSASGGQSGSASGGQSGGASGGQSGSASGGQSGSASGGAAGNSSGGQAGTASGGAGGGNGGVNGTMGGQPGTGGRQTGGTTGVGGGNGGVNGTMGGQPGSGGSQTGGAQGTGGTTTPSTVLVTSAQNAYWVTTGTLTTVTSNADITVNDATTYQTWDGFGGSFNEMGWDDLANLSQADRDKAMQLLFGTDGAHFVFGRIPIGASDYAMDRYTLDETKNDYTMASFSIDRDKQKLIPYIKAALAVNPNVRLWASPWTPPTWMKTNSGSYNGTSCAGTGSTAYDGGCMMDNDQILQAHALYLAKFVQAYQGEGMTIEAVHPQNEPNYATGYPSCLWTPALFAKYVGQYLGPTFTSQSVSAKIYLGTMSNNDSGKDGSIITTVTGDSTAMKYIAGFGLQWNMQPVVSGLTSRNLPIMQTEHKCGNYPWESSTFKSDKAPNDHAYGIESWGLIRDWIKTGVNSYSSWNMVLDTIGTGIDAGRLWPQNALLTVDVGAKKLTATPAYYVFRHFSQFVAPGAKRVATSGSSPDTLAFKNPDGKIVAIMYNSGSARTTTVSIGGAKLQFSMPASSFATVMK
jgi:glucosylceramidase